MSEAHSALGMVRHHGSYDWPGAEREFRRALALNPGDSLGRSWFADVLATWPGRSQEAVAEARRALECDPLSPFAAFVVGLTLVCTRQFRDAIGHASEMLDLHPTNHMVKWILAMGWAAEGELDRATDILKEGLELAPGDAHLTAYLGWVLGLNGDNAAAEKTLTGLVTRRESGYVSAFQIAMTCVSLGRAGEALDWLEQAYADGDPLLAYAGVWWICDPLQSDPRFQALLRRMNFPQQP